MPTKRIDSTAFALFVYERGTEKDFEQFSADVDSLCRDTTFTKDIVLDFGSGLTALPSEIALIVTVFRSIQGTSRILRLIPNVNMLKKLELMRLDKSQNLTIYKDRRSFLVEYTGNRLNQQEN